MVSLRPVNFSAIERYIPDFQKRSKTAENVPNHAELLGIFDGDYLAGYFIVAGYETGELEINQGYLNQENRHKDMSKVAMCLLEQKAKKAGFKKVILASSRTLRAYTKFMKGLGYKPERIIYSKSVR